MIVALKQIHCRIRNKILKFGEHFETFEKHTNTKLEKKGIKKKVHVVSK